MVHLVTLKFNPDNMTVSDLKSAAQTLRGILMDYDKAPDDWESAGCSVAQVRNAYIVDKRTA